MAGDSDEIKTSSDSVVKTTENSLQPIQVQPRSFHKFKSVGELIWKAVVTLFSQLGQVIITLLKKPQELFLFIVTLAIITLIIVLFYYSSIRNEVNKNSRCIQEKRNSQVGGIYSVEAYNDKNEPMYMVSYDLAVKKFDISCACRAGHVVNHFNDIKIYDIRNPKNPIRKIPEKICNCDRYIDKSKTYYKGYPDVVRFMNNNDISFFSATKFQGS